MARIIKRTDTIAKRLKITRIQVIELIESGKLPIQKDELGKYYLNQSDLDNYILNLRLKVLKFGQESKNIMKCDKA